MADDLDRETEIDRRKVQLEELGADASELSGSVPGIVDAINRAIRMLTDARQAIEELGTGCRQIAERASAGEQKAGR